MADKIPTDALGQGNPIREWSEGSALTTRYDQLIADGAGDIPLREFRRLGKCLFQAGFGESPCSDRSGPQRHHTGRRP
jgi:hypothetical protein